MSQLSSFVAALLLNLLSVGIADSFLTPRDNIQEVASEDVKQLVLSELAGVRNPDELEQIETVMRDTVVSLPKNEHNKLDPVSVRYALHRYFVQKHGWYVKGLGKSVVDGNLSMSKLLKSRAPAYIQSLMEERFHGQGMVLHDVAVFAATLTQLIHAEAVNQLEWIFKVLGLSQVDPVPRRSATEAIDAFFGAYLRGGNYVASSYLQLKKDAEMMLKLYPNYQDTAMWVQDTTLTFDWAEASSRNPFAIESHYSFDTSVRLTQELGHRFGAFQNLECHSLKRKLTSMEHMGSGRVLLAKFYSGVLWEFSESADYLRNQGALDESDPSRPAVIIPNYLNSHANCLTASNFYMICCQNECEVLMGKLETELQVPRATPLQIAAVVERTSSDTVYAPRNLSSAMISRLNQIADVNGGKVPLHGRLFAQWMHHAYPRECPYPHVTGSVPTPLSPIEWLLSRGRAALDADAKEIAKYVNLQPTSLNESLTLPWDLSEELVAEDRVASTGLGLSLTKALAALAAMISFLAPMMQSFKSTSCTSLIQNEKIMV